MPLRDELTGVIKNSIVDMPGELTEGTSLIRSGLCDSWALFQIVQWVERQVGHPVDPTKFDLAAEWDTVDDIVSFVEKNRMGGRG